jgi:hypothetical protein
LNPASSINNYKERNNVHSLKSINYVRIELERKLFMQGK